MLNSQAAVSTSKRVLVTGACGFIGTVLCFRLLGQGHDVIGVDNLSRRGAELNASDLLTKKKFSLHRIDLADREALSGLFSKIGPLDALFHLAGQVAVTHSYQDPREDFNSNLLGSFNLLEAVRSFTPDAYCLYASTNKVYGPLSDVSCPVGDKQPVDPHTPYGISKAAAELYFTEYGRKSIGLTTCSLRQSCIYGHHQYGTEDQGWLAWFAVANLLSKPVTIYGDGHQVRDLLFIDDLVALYSECFARRLRGTFTVGGGAANAISINEALALIVRLTGRPFVDIRHDVARAGDQPYFVADLGWTQERNLTWKPRVCIEDGLDAMISWLRKNLR